MSAIDKPRTGNRIPPGGICPICDFPFRLAHCPLCARCTPDAGMGICWQCIAPVFAHQGEAAAARFSIDAMSRHLEQYFPEEDQGPWPGPGFDGIPLDKLDEWMKER